MQRLTEQGLTKCIKANISITNNQSVEIFDNFFCTSRNSLQVYTVVNRLILKITIGIMSLDLAAIQKRTYEKKNAKTDTSALTSFLSKDISLKRKKFSLNFKEKLYHELSTLFGAGLDLKSSLDLYCSHLKGWQQEVFTGIINYIVRGDSLHIALQKTGLFSSYEYYTVKLGEEIGKLDKSFTELYNYYGRRIKLKKQIVSAMTYPLLVLVTTLLVVTFMLGFIVPMFSDVFKRFDSELPALTKFIISLSHNYKSYLLALFLTVSVFIGLYYILKKRKWFVKTFHQIVLKTPLAGRLIKNSQLSKLFQTFYLLLSSGIPLISSIDICLEVIQYAPLQESLKAIREKMIKGATLYESMGEENFFEKSDMVLIKTGEEVNKLDEIFEKLSNQYQSKTEYEVNMLNNFLEPALIVFVGGLVAVILISMYLPMFQLSTGFF